MKQYLFPKCAFFALVLLFPLFLQAQITKAVGGDYITLMGVPENQIAAQVNTYKGQGYMPVFADAVYFEGKPLQGTSRPAHVGILATLIFKKNPTRIDVQLAKYNSTNAFVAQYGALKAQGWYISNLDAYLNMSKQESYLAIWVKGNSAPWGITVDMPVNQHQNAFNQLSSEGYKLVNRVYHDQPSGEEVTGIQHVTSLYTKLPNSVFSKSKLSYPEYAKLCVDMKQQGFVLTYLDTDRGNYSPIFTKNPNFTPFSTFPAHSQTSVQVKQAIEQWSQQGYYPLFVICDSHLKEDYYPKYAIWFVKP